MIPDLAYLTAVNTCGYRDQGLSTCQACSLAGVSARQLGYWRKAGLDSPIMRTRGGYARYCLSASFHWKPPVVLGQQGARVLLIDMDHRGRFSGAQGCRCRSGGSIRTPQRQSPAEPGTKSGRRTALQPVVAAYLNFACFHPSKYPSSNQ